MFVRRSADRGATSEGFLVGSRKKWPITTAPSRARKNRPIAIEPYASAARVRPPAAQRREEPPARVGILGVGLLDSCCRPTTLVISHTPLHHLGNDEETNPGSQQ